MEKSLNSALLMDLNSALLMDHPIRVFLVDDQEIIGKTVRSMLESETDIELHFCQDPARALRMATHIKPTVILQDLVMPDIDGLTLVHYFHVCTATRDVPLVVLSSEEDAAVKASAFFLGANDYLVKLPEKPELVARIRYHSKSYITLLERNEAMQALIESRKQLEIHNRFIRETFGRYLSNEVVESLLDTPHGLNLGGEKREVTIMMADLRGFTPISERLPPEDVVKLINIYLECMTDIILKYQGTIDEFIGDAILVVFGAPLRREDEPDQAVACAVEMQHAMVTVNARNREAGFPEVDMGIGIHTGKVVVGNIGSRKRAKYGIVGGAVNLTSRIESFTVGGQILVSESTLNSCACPLRIDSRTEVMPKGVQEPITICEIGGIGGKFNLYLPQKQQLVLHPVSEKLRFTILKGKDAGSEFFFGTMRKLAANKACEVETDAPIKCLDNLKITVLGPEGGSIAENLYGKVTAQNNPRIFLIQFTALPPQTEKFFKTALKRTGSKKWSSMESGRIDSGF
ncbi:MAG: response regulator [Gammaproteobacteria bacterium]|nr:response regulator [Gammaproteobacteria bacterium]